MTANDLAIAGFVPFSTVDWPGRLVATLFLQGCPWNCGYCQNPSLIDSRVPGEVRWRDVKQTLDRRIGLLDGVVFSGGEPTRQPAVVEAVLAVRAMDFQVAIHTAGAFPDRLEQLLPHLAWVGLDIKAPPATYASVTRVEASGDRAWRSLDMVVASGVPYEVRLTVDPTVHRLAEVEEVVAELERRGAHAPVLQEVRPDGARAEYVARLGSVRLQDVVPVAALPSLERRYSQEASAASTGLRTALSIRDTDRGPRDTSPPV